MGMHRAERRGGTKHELRRYVPHALLPLSVALAYLAGGEIALISTAFAAPVLYIMYDLYTSDQKGPTSPTQLGILSRQELIGELEHLRVAAAGSGRQSAVFVVRLDDPQTIADRHGRKGIEHTIGVTQERLRSALRETDFFGRLDDTTFAAVLGPVRRLDLEAGIQLASRLQSTAADAISFSGLSINPSVSVGFCLQSRLPGVKGAQLLEAGEAAMEEAHRNGPGAIRSFAKDMVRRSVNKSSLHDQIEDALENGQILPHFQPQVDTETGTISGAEALARWKHPEIGLISPTEFLPIVHESGLTERLGEVMLYQSLTTLREWDNEGLLVPHVGINFAGAELRNPKLAEKIQWELDRFEMAPDRLTVEVLETVFAHEDGGIVNRNIQGLRALGCRVDLDDFGIGQASIAHIQTFRVNRIKIDRSFVSKIDIDENQRRLVAAILTMAEELEVETLAEGVETKGEHAILAQLGCRHVQGYGVARPMPAEAFLDWARAHQATLTNTIDLHRRAV